MHKNVQKMHKICTAAAQWPEHTGVEWGGPFVPILLSSLVSQIPRLSVFTIFQLPFNCRLSDHPRLPIFNYFSIVIKHNARISMGLVSFQFAFNTQTLAIKSVVSYIQSFPWQWDGENVKFFLAVFHWNEHDFHIIYLM